jgi:hypothetical protein
VLLHVSSYAGRDVVEALRDDLLSVANSPTQGEIDEELPGIASEALGRL